MKFVWNKYNLATAIKLWEDHESASVISSKIGTTKNSVISKMRHLREAGVDLRRGVSMRPITVSDKTNRLPKPTSDWPEGDTASLVKLWNEGKSIPEIMPILKRTHGSVKNKLERLRDRGLLMRGIDRAGRVKTGPKPKPTTKPQEAWGVREMRTAFPGKRQEARVQEFTRAGMSQVEKFEARMTNKGVPLMEVRAYQCRFPTSAAWPWLMCGERVEHGSYCPSCSERVNGRAA